MTGLCKDANAENTSYRMAAVRYFWNCVIRSSMDDSLVPPTVIHETSTTAKKLYKRSTIKLWVLSYMHIASKENLFKIMFYNKGKHTTAW